MYRCIKVLRALFPNISISHKEQQHSYTAFLDSDCRSSLNLRIILQARSLTSTFESPVLYQQKILEIAKTAQDSEGLFRPMEDSSLCKNPCSAVHDKVEVNGVSALDVSSRILLLLALAPTIERTANGILYFMSRKRQKMALITLIGVCSLNDRSIMSCLNLCVRYLPSTWHRICENSQRVVLRSYRL